MGQRKLFDEKTEVKTLFRPHGSSGYRTNFHYKIRIHKTTSSKLFIGRYPVPTYRIGNLAEKTEKERIGR